MKKNYPPLSVKNLFGFRIFITAVFLIVSIIVNAQCPPGVQCDLLRKIGTLASTNGAEISAFDPASKRVFTVAGPVIEWHTMSNAGVLTLGGSLPLGFLLNAGENALPNSVAVSGGILAASYTVTTLEGNPAGVVHNDGRVSFYNAATGAVLKVVTVGSLPDMVVFTQDGKKLLSANEGEPSSYGRATSVDPQGSISIIDLSNGVANATVQHATFQSYIGQENALRAQGVRIFGPNANAAQDFEPEYIAISPDGTKAWVTLQENNAFAVVDIASATVTQIIPLGLKDHSKPTVLGLQTFEFNNMPSIGITAGGQDMKLGGFSGLAFEGYAANGNMKFITHTDRGPNGEPSGQIRPFALPNFTPEIVRFEVNRTTGQVTLTQRIQLKRSNGQLLTGLPNINLPGGTENTPNHDEIGVDLSGNLTGVDPLGADLEGIIKADDGSFWMIDEYRPALYHFDPAGVLIKRFVPTGTAAAASMPAGTYGVEALPSVIAQRRQNRGFEGIAFQDGKLYLFVQSPIRNPTTTANGALNTGKYTRVVEFNPATETTTAQYIYVMDNNAPTGGAADTRADKIGDAVSMGNGDFLVLERDDDAIDSDPQSTIQKKIYRFSLAGATNVNTLPNVFPNGKTIEEMTLAELAALATPVLPITKYLHIDLASNYNMTEKVEGLTIVDCNTIGVINDNDFGVAGLTYGAGVFNGYPSSTAEKPLLGLISVRNNGLDASDQDSKINIKHWPVFGMYLPDAIATYTVTGQTYYITANEGDSRADWPGYTEEIRVGAAGYVLDPAVFPNASVLKNNANLGRLQLTRANGSTDADAEFEQIHALGARSFSIWNSAGQQVYDSGDELEQLTAALSAASFNSDGTAASFDTRSDNKGPEIEAVIVGIVGGRAYAFVGSERTGDIFVYDVSNPLKPVFIQYINTPEDMGVEGIAFVSAANSPTGRPLVITSAEVSKTVTVFEVNAPICSITAVPANNTYTGGVPTNIYLGYGPQSVTLKVADQTAAGAPYTYAWTGDATLSNTNTANPVFTASEAGSYTFTVTVTSKCGVASTCSITICVTDIRVTGSNNKVYICHAPPDNPANAKTLSVSVNAVPEHLLSHPEDKLGKCGEEPCQPLLTRKSTQVIEEEIVTGMQVATFPNPSSNYFTLRVSSDKNDAVEIRVMDAQGRKVYAKRGQQGSYSFGHEFARGLYIVEVTQGNRKQVIKLTKQ
ncbi:MAG TPA: esterase-like activity of phytase family protein [Chitinophagaceae bacterium]